MQDKTEHVLHRMKAIQHDNNITILIVACILSILGCVWTALIENTIGLFAVGILPIVCIGMYVGTKKTGWGIAYLVVFLLSNFGIFIEVLTLKGVFIYVGIAAFFAFILVKNDKQQREIDALEKNVSIVKYTTVIDRGKKTSDVDEIKQIKCERFILLYSIVGIGCVLSLITLIATLLCVKKTEIVILCVLSMVCSIMMGITKKQVWGACYLIMFILPRYYIFTHNNKGIPILIVMGFMAIYLTCMCLIYVYGKKVKRLQEKNIGGETVS